MDRRELEEAWQADEPPAGFAERTVERAMAAKRPALRRAGVRVQANSNSEVNNNIIAFNSYGLELDVTVPGVAMRAKRRSCKC